MRRASRVQPRTSPLNKSPFLLFPPGIEERAAQPAVPAFRISSSSERVNKPTIKSPSPPPAPRSDPRRGSQPLLLGAGLLLAPPAHRISLRGGRGSDGDGAVAARRGAAGSLLDCSCRRRSLREQHRRLPSLSPCSWYALAFPSLTSPFLSLSLCSLF